ncbi:MAG: hypothetical protein GF393_01165, partial [Armatimonadia bacterium]|nr:hypothetical protein [Armatimonadia bacterium]
MKFASLRSSVLLAAVLMVILSSPTFAVDTDGDGLPDDVEQRLGTHVDMPEEFEMIAHDEVGDSDPEIGGRMDIAAVRCANIAHDRWLWAVSFDEPYQPENAGCTLYVDVDGDALTGRPQTGCEVAYVCFRGQPVTHTWLDNSDLEAIPDGRVAVVDGVIYYCGDVPLSQVDDRTRYRIKVLVQTHQPAVNRDRFGFVPVEGPANSEIEPERTAETGIVRGTVMGPNGEPVPGARIRGILSDATLDPVNPEFDVTADEAGRFEIEAPPGRYALLATKGVLTSHRIGSESLTIGAGSLEEGVTLRLREGTTLSGRVTAKATGEPVPSATIVVDAKLTAITGDDGRYTIEAVAEGPQSMLVTASGLAHEFRDIHVRQGDPNETDLALEPGFDIRGTVTDEAGDPVEGVRIRHQAYSRRWEERRLRATETNAEGRWEMPGFARDDLAAIEFSHPDFTDQLLEAIRAPENGDVLTLDLTLREGYAVEGMVVDGAAQAVIGAEVWVMAPEGRQFRSMRADSNRLGQFRIEHIPSDAETLLFATQREQAPTWTRVTPGPPDAPATVTLEMQAGHTASGSVLDADGNPVASAAVVADYRFGPRNQGWGSSRTSTDQDGQFTVTGLPASGVEVRIDADGHSQVRDVPIEVGDETNEIVLNPPGTIVGRVIDEATDRPITEFRVRLVRSDEAPPGAPRSVTVPMSGDGIAFAAEDGMFVVERLTFGAAYAVVVDAEGYAPARVDPVTAARREAGEWP